MIQNLLLAHDFSPSADRALSYAVDLVERTGATLHLVYVQETPLGPFVRGEPSPEPGAGKLQRQFEERCKDALTGYSLSVDDENVSSVLRRSGAVAPALVRLADERNIDLIAMGTHGRRGVERALFGSVAEEVLRTAPCPVLTTRATGEGEGHSQEGPGSIERIVVPIDFSDLSRTALRYAVQLASVYRVPVTLVHVVYLPELPPIYKVEYSEGSLQNVEARVEETFAEWTNPLPIERRNLSYVVESGDPVPAILRVASDDDLLVMATRGLSGLKRTMLGSVAEGVLRRAPGPVLSGRTFPEVE